MQSKATLSSFHAGILARDLRIVAFYPYTTFVQNRILETEQNENLPATDPFMVIVNEIKARALAIGCRWDNKVADD